MFFRAVKPSLTGNKMPRICRVNYTDLWTRGTPGWRGHQSRGWSSYWTRLEEAENRHTNTSAVYKHNPISMCQHEHSDHLLCSLLRLNGRSLHLQIPAVQLHHRPVLHVTQDLRHRLVRVTLKHHSHCM